MAKNMTRKGLAAASTLALAVTGLVGLSTPAAANTMVLEPSAGTSQRVPVSETFDLTTYHAAGDNIYNQNLSILVSDPDDGLTNFIVGTTTTTARDADGNMYAEAATTGAPQTITLTPSGTETFSVVVTTFIDAPSGAGNNDTPDTGETQKSFEVFFHNEDDYTWNLSFDAPAYADEKFTASVSTSPELNLAQFASEVKVEFATIASNGALAIKTDNGGVTTPDFDGGTAGSGADAEISNDGSTISYEVDVLDASSTPTNTVNNATYAAGLVYGTAEVARKLAVVGEASIVQIDTPVAVVGPDVNGTDLRKESTSVTIEAQLDSDTSTNPDTPAAAGQEVTVTITSADAASVTGTWNADSELTAGGETLTANSTDDKITFTVTTDADGKASFSVDVSDVFAGDDFEVAFAAQGQTNSDVFQVLETAAADLVEHNLLGDSAEWKVEDGSHTIRFAALDNFGQPLSGSDYRVVLTPVIAGPNDVTTEQQAASLSGGVATFNVNTTTEDDEEVLSFRADLQVASGASFSNVGVAGTVSLAVNLGSSNVATEVSVTSNSGAVTGASGSYATSDDFTTTGWELATVEFSSANERLGEAVGVTLPSTKVETLSGSLTDASGLNTYGSVTFTGEGLLFKAPATNQGLDVYSLGSITVQTNTSGAFDGVQVFSNQAGEQTVTVSSGSASQDIVLDFDPAASDSGTSLVIDAPSTVEPGSTLVYTVSLTDDFGNAVNGGSGSTDSIELAYDGPGFIVGDALGETSFGTDGELIVTVFLGNNDDGKTGTLTVSYSPDNDGTYTDDDDLVVQKTVNIGAVPGGVAGEFSAWTKLSDDQTNVKFYAKNPSGAGKIQFFFNGSEIAWHRGTSATSYEGGAPRYNTDQDAYYLVRDRDLVVGSQNVFEIYQDGTRIWRAVKTID